MLRFLPIPALFVNVACMFLSMITGDMKVLAYSTIGAGCAWYGLLYYLEERRKAMLNTNGHRSLAMRLRWEIVEERLPPGQRLPSVRQLAARFNTSRVTVTKALRLLAEEDLVETVRGRGSYVTGSGGLSDLRSEAPRDRVEKYLVSVCHAVPAGAELPGAQDLITRFEVSAPTVRRAQLALIRRGLIKRTRRGLYVKA